LGASEKVRKSVKDEEISEKGKPAAKDAVDVPLYLLLGYHNVL
jgi:hypothetical protein